MTTTNHALPGHWAICSKCRGDGHNASHLGAITSDEWAQWHDDEKQDYMAGAYDKTCGACDGSGKVRVVDVAQCTFAQKRALVEQRRSARWDAEARHEQERESRMLGEWS